MAKRTKSSSRWLAEHESDPFVKRARAGGWRSRAVFKLEELDRREKLFRPGMRVVDLGSAPGAWSQYAVRKAPGIEVIAVDILPMDPLPGVTSIEGDFREDAVLAALREALGGRRADLVMSDMAPNMSGVAAVDQPRSMYLAELALDFCGEGLTPGGTLVTKLFQGEGFEEFLASARQAFASVRTRKPEASRDRSSEVYLVARNYRL